MIIETGKVVSVEPEGLWVETISRSVCGSCKAEKGCGQSLMAKWAGHTSYIWVLLEGRDPTNYHQGDSVNIGVPEEVVAKGSLFIYSIPLITLLMFTFIANKLFSNEPLIVLSGLVGLCVGGLLVRWHAERNRFNPNLQPVIVDERKTVKLIQPE